MLNILRQFAIMLSVLLVVCMFAFMQGLCFSTIRSRRWARALTWFYLWTAFLVVGWDLFGGAMAKAVLAPPSGMVPGALPHAMLFQHFTLSTTWILFRGTFVVCVVAQVNRTESVCI